MTVPEARSRCAALHVLAWDDGVIARELARATAAFLSASPQVSPVRDAQEKPGTWWIGAGGFEQLGGERALALTLLEIARAWHPKARVAIADSCVAARAATWAVPAFEHASVKAAREGHGSVSETRPQDREAVREGRGNGPVAQPSGDGGRAEPRIIPPGGCAAYLARAPTALIPMDEELRDALTALGLRTAGAFAALDPGEVERRWGAEGLASWRLANGDDARRPVLARTDAARVVSTELAMATATMEPVLFIVRAALGQLVDALIHDGRAAAAIAITLTLDDARGAIPAGFGHALDEMRGASAGVPAARGAPHTVTREVRPAAPVARVAPLFERCHALLDQWTLAAPVSAVTVTVSATAPLGAEQGDLLATAWRDPAAADAAFERLRAELGAGSVVRAVVRDEHRPEKAGEWTEILEAGLGSGFRGLVQGEAAVRGAAAVQGSDPAPCTAPAPGTRPLNPAPSPAPEFTSPPPARLLHDPEPVDVATPRGIPRTMWWRGQRIAIARAVGPERISGDWWKDPYARDYWRCESDELARDFLLYRDAEGWRLQGWYD